MGNASPLKLISIVGLSGSGKTTLVEKIITELSQKGLRVGTIKHSCHPHPLDVKGKDSWRHKQAGAERTLFVGPECIQLVSDVEAKETPIELAEKFLANMDVAIVEGFLHSDTEKIEVVRGERSEMPAAKVEEGLVAIATDLTETLTEKTTGVPCFELNDYIGVSVFIVKHLALKLPDSKSKKQA
jgi:molybdopterin-guanine dinucleotide biosynthesis protein B